MIAILNNFGFMQENYHQTKLKLLHKCKGHDHEEQKDDDMCLDEVEDEHQTIVDYGSELQAPWEGRGSSFRVFAVLLAVAGAALAVLRAAGSAEELKGRFHFEQPDLPYTAKQHMV